MQATVPQHVTQPRAAPPRSRHGAGAPRNAHRLLELVEEAAAVAAALQRRHHLVFGEDGLELLEGEGELARFGEPAAAHGELVLRLRDFRHWVVPAHKPKVVRGDPTVQQELSRSLRLEWLIRVHVQRGVHLGVFGVRVVLIEAQLDVRRVKHACRPPLRVHARARHTHDPWGGAVQCAYSQAVGDRSERDPCPGGALSPICMAFSICIGAGVLVCCLYRFQKPSMALPAASKMRLPPGCAWMKSVMS
mmetsp:Transcript_24923/g.64303  ORF Transcript_24923/g.64303 Transcript_24923/m.64303 type:complete len:248 (+) Transcript_24923:1016-1759(+)